jgi:hypothetical protein
MPPHFVRALGKGRTLSGSLLDLPSVFAGFEMPTSPRRTFGRAKLDLCRMRISELALYFSWNTWERPISISGQEPSRLSGTLFAILDAGEDFHCRSISDIWPQN